MDVSLELSDDLVARLRQVAQSQGTTLNELVRRTLELIAGKPAGEVLADEMKKFWAQAPGHSSGRRIDRADVYDTQRS